MKTTTIQKMLVLANKLDQAGDFAAADGIDLCLEQLCGDCPIEEDDERFLVVVLKELDEEQDLDDGRFGLNDADNPTVKAAMVHLAHSLRRSQMFSEAKMVKQAQGGKQPTLPLPPQETAYSLYRIILHMIQRASPEKRTQYLNSMRRSLNKLNALDIAMKRSNPQAGVGAAINIIKNILIGQDPGIINSVLMELRRLI